MATKQDVVDYLVEVKGASPEDANSYVDSVGLESAIAYVSSDGGASMAQPAAEEPANMQRGVTLSKPASILQAGDILGSPSRELLTRLTNAVARGAGYKDVYPGIEEESSTSAIGSYPGFSEIYEKAGMGDYGTLDVPGTDIRVTGRDALGLTSDILSDPLTYVPLANILSVGTKLAGKIGPRLESAAVSGYGRVFDSLMKEAAKKAPPKSVQAIPRALLDAGAKGSYENIQNKVAAQLENLNEKAMTMAENVPYGKTPQEVRNLTRPITSDVLQNPTAAKDYADADAFFQQIENFQRPGLSEDKAKWMKQARAYIAEKKAFEKAGGTGNQPPLSPSLQFGRTAPSTRSVELQGQPARIMEPKQYTPEQMNIDISKEVTPGEVQYSLFAEQPSLDRAAQRSFDIKLPDGTRVFYPESLPVGYRRGAPEISIPGINLSKSQQMKILVEKGYSPSQVNYILSLPEADIYAAMQREISGTDLIPRSYAKTPANKYEEMSGQGVFPVVPTLPDPVKNTLTTKDLIRQKSAAQKEAGYDKLGMRPPVYKEKIAQGAEILRKEAIDTFEKAGQNVEDLWRQESALLSAAPIIEREVIKESKKPFITPFDFATLFNQYTAPLTLAKKGYQAVTGVPLRTNMYEALYRSGKGLKNIGTVTPESLPFYLRKPLYGVQQTAPEEEYLP